MRIKQITCLPYTLQLDQHPERQIAILTLDSDLGISHGEIAPYPSLSKETLSQSIQQLTHIMPFLQNIEWNLSQLTLLDTLKLYPSVHFALESALLALLDPLPDFTCELCGLIQGSLSNMMQQAEDAIQKGYSTLKIKIGHLSISDALSLIKRFSAVKLRLDINRCYNPKQAWALISHLSLRQIEYIEEPLDDIEALKEFPFPFALDETIRDHDITPLLAHPHLKALIIKPPLLGAYSAVRNLKSLGSPLVLSSCYESGLGLMQVAALGKRLDLLTQPSGLDTYRLIKNDLIQPPIQNHQPYLSIPQNYALSHLPVQTITS